MHLRPHLTKNLGGRARPAGLALFSAVLLTLAFPPWDLASLAWVALVPLFIVLDGQNCKCAFVWAFLTGSSFSMGLGYWVETISGFTLLEFLLGGVYWGSYIGLFGLLVWGFAQNRRLPFCLTAPPVWVSVEYLRSHIGFLGIPWSLLGHTQYRNIPLLQIASLTGVYGLSFLIVLVNATISAALLYWLRGAPQAWPHHRFGLLVPTALSVCLLGTSLLYGFRVLATPVRRETVRVTVLQGDILPDRKWKPEFLRLNLETHVRLTKEAVSAIPASLIVWPEGSVEGSLTQDLYEMNAVATLVEETNTHFLIGNLQRPKFGSREFRKENRFNTASLLAPGKGIVGQYHKMYLLPFGEYLPYKETFPWPGRIAELSKTRVLLPGEEYTLFELQGHRFSVLICWETLFPDLVRQFVKNGAEFLINITNEARLGETAVPHQVLAMNVFRAVENRVAIARAANTGISGFIDPYGRLTGRVQDQNGKALFVAGYLTQDVPLARERTVYTMYGDIWAYGNLVFTAGLLSLCSLRARR